MPRLILVLIVIGITIYAVIDCLRTDDADIRIMPKPLWLLVIIAPPWIGGVFWIWLGARKEGPGPGGRPQPRTIAPDDDPEFLRSLNKPRNPPPGPEHA